MKESLLMSSRRELGPFDFEKALELKKLVTNSFKQYGVSKELSDGKKLHVAFGMFNFQQGQMDGVGRETSKI